MTIDETPIMEEEERRQARQRSLESLRPPLHVSGYEQERFVGKGSFGEVWTAVNSNNGRRVAIKFYNRRGNLDWSLLAREVEKLRHLFTDRYVVQLFEVGWDSDPPYYVMEYMENGSLEERLRRGPLPVVEAVALFREVAIGLVHAHGKGILHCDLKPANVLLDQDLKPRLADFGQARMSREPSPALGTLFFMAPEQANLEALPDARWDVYALGALLHTMLTGQPPFRTSAGAAEVMKAGRLEERLKLYRRFLHEAPRPIAHRLVPDVDPSLADIVDRCLDLNPRSRFPNAQTVLNALNDRANRLARRPLLILGTFGPALAVLIMAIFATWLFFRTVKAAEREVLDRALESNQFAARTVAERWALEIDRRWTVLEKEAQDPKLRQWLTLRGRLKDSPEGETLNAWIKERHEYWNNYFQRDEEKGAQSPIPNPEKRWASLWFAHDRDGFQRALSPPDKKNLNIYRGFRDYFHGQKRDFPQVREEQNPKPETRNPKPEIGPPSPIQQPHLSIPYHRQRSPEDGGCWVWSVAFSVPVFSLGKKELVPFEKGPPDPRPNGILGMTVDLEETVQIQGSKGQFAVLIDTRPDQNGKQGMIIMHRYWQEQPRNRLTEPPVYHSPEVVKWVEELGMNIPAGVKSRHSMVPGDNIPPTGQTELIPNSFLGRKKTTENYEDPVGQDNPNYGGKWLAALEPIAIPSRAGNHGNNGSLVVLVQEKPEETLEPLRKLTNRLIGTGLLALIMVMVLVGGLWAVVLLTLREGRRSRLMAFLRRRQGLVSESSTGSAKTGGDKVTSKEG